MPDQDRDGRYFREIAAARRLGLSMGEAETRRLLHILQDFVDELTARIKPGTVNRAEPLRGLARNLLRELTEDLTAATANGARITARAVLERHALATARLLADAGSSVNIAGVFAGIDAGAAQALLSRPELSAAFKTVHTVASRDIDSLLVRAAAGGTPSTSLAQQLRMYVIGSEGLPEELINNRRLITAKGLERLGIPGTPENVSFMRDRAGRVALRAQLIARTEMANAQHEAAVAAAEASPVVAAVKWSVANRHPERDACDVFAEADHHGLGKGVWDKRRVPPRPHPRCLCLITHVLIEDEEEWGEELPPAPPLQWKPDAMAAQYGLGPSQLKAMRRAIAVGRTRKPLQAAATAAAMPSPVASPDAPEPAPAPDTTPTIPVPDAVAAARAATLDDGFEQYIPISNIPGGITQDAKVGLPSVAAETAQQAPVLPIELKRIVVAGDAQASVEPGRVIQYIRGEVEIEPGALDDDGFPIDYPVLYELKDGRFTILEGHHRIAAAAFRGQPGVEARVILRRKLDDPTPGPDVPTIVQQQAAHDAAEKAMAAAAREKTNIGKMQAAIRQAEDALEQAKASGSVGAEALAKEALDLAKANLAARRAANKKSSQRFAQKNSAAVKALQAAKEAAEAKRAQLLAVDTAQMSPAELKTMTAEIDAAINAGKAAGLSEQAIQSLTTLRQATVATLQKRAASAAAAHDAMDALEDTIKSGNLQELDVAESKLSEALLKAMASKDAATQARANNLFSKLYARKNELALELQKAEEAIAFKAGDIASPVKLSAMKNDLAGMKTARAALLDLKAEAKLLQAQMGGDDDITVLAQLDELIHAIDDAILVKQNANKKSSAKFAAKKKLDLALAEAEKIAKSATLPKKHFGPDVAKALKTLTHEERVSVIKEALEAEYKTYLTTLDSTGSIEAAELAAKSAFDQKVALLEQALHTPGGLKAAVAKNVGLTPAQAAGVNSAQATAQAVKAKATPSVNASGVRSLGQGDAKVILGRQLEGAKGSNPGGIYEGTDGVRRYVKFYDDPAQARGEALANDIYRRLGLEAPESVVFEHNGKLAHATPILDIKGTVGNAGLTKDVADQILDGFAADMLTGNWDAVGMSLDNVVVLKNGRIARIDQGGTFLMRAKAGRKQPTLLQQLTEWEGFTSKNPAYSGVFQKAGVSAPGELGDRLIAQIDAVLDLEKKLGGWDSYVKASFPDWSHADRQAIVDMLAARSKLLAKKRDEIRQYAIDKIRIEREMADLLAQARTKKAAGRSPEEKASITRAVAHVKSDPRMTPQRIAALKKVITQNQGNRAAGALDARSAASQVREAFMEKELAVRGVSSTTARAIIQHIDGMYSSWQGSAQSDAAMGLKFFGVVDAGATNTYWNGYINLDPVKQQQFLAAGRKALTGSGRFKEEDVIAALRAERAFNRAMGEDVLGLPKFKLWRRVSNYFKNQQLPVPQSGTVGVFRHNGVTGWTSVQGSYGGTWEFEAEFDWDDVMRSYWWHNGGFQNEHEWWIFGFDHVMKATRVGGGGYD